MRYFKENEIDKYIYYRIPKPLFSNAKYKHMMTLSKVLYGIFLDRCSLSRINGWVDQEGRVYFYFKISDICFSKLPVDFPLKIIVLPTNQTLFK